MKTENIKSHKKAGQVLRSSLVQAADLFEGDFKEKETKDKKDDTTKF